MECFLIREICDSYTRWATNTEIILLKSIGGEIKFLKNVLRPSNAFYGI